MTFQVRKEKVVVPGYYLVWYNHSFIKVFNIMVVVPGYYLVWYNNYLVDIISK